MEIMTIRPTTLEDREAVLNIADNIYAGIDYLPFYYDYFIKSPHIKSYLAIVDGHVVGFLACQLVDGGATYIHRAGRVKAGFTGKGVFKALTQYVRNEHTDKILVFSASNRNPSIEKEAFKAANKDILSRDISVFSFNSTVGPSSNKDSVLLRGNCVDETILESIFNNPKIRDYLFPHGRIIVSWVPYQIMQSNVSQIFAAGVHAFSDVIETSDGCVKGLLSLVTVYPCKKPDHCCDVDIYGTDVKSLEPHMEYLLGILRESIIGVVAVRFYMEPGICTSISLDTIAQCGLSEDCAIKKPFIQHVFEQK